MVVSTDDPRYESLVRQIVAAREQKGLSKRQLADRLGQDVDEVSRVERRQSPLGLVELADWVEALELPLLDLLQEAGFVPSFHGSTPVPVRVHDAPNGIVLVLGWQGGVREVVIEHATVDAYRRVETEIKAIFAQLNAKRHRYRNRDAIAMALELAVTALPQVNPSDIYHHIVYRLYLLEYNNTKAEQSWVRAGGEGVELFIAKWYAKSLGGSGVSIEALISGARKRVALGQMGLTGSVGNSKLDLALYGIRDGIKTIFGGIHSKASLAERVSDDVPCSQAMMRKGLVSYLYTFDAKSFPPPAGDLVNRGELGSVAKPSDKRQYVEEHGSFDACFSYNLRGEPSPEVTPSGKRIYVSSLLPRDQDPFPRHVLDAWERFQQRRRT